MSGISPLNYKNKKKHSRVKIKYNKQSQPRIYLSTNLKSVLTDIKITRNINKKIKIK